MHHPRLILSLLLALLLTGMVLPAYAQTPTSTSEPTSMPDQESTEVSQLTYTVRLGDTLFRIAVRYGLTVQQLAEANGITNPALIFPGQQLIIPGITPTPAPPSTPTLPPEPTSAPTPTTQYTVQIGDTLYKIAVRFRTTISRLLALNNLSNPDIIYVGQVLQIPSETTSPTPTLSVTPEILPTDQTETAPTDLPSITEEQGGGTATGYGFDYGIEAFMAGQDIPVVTDEISRLGMQWVKQTISWRDLEPVRGQIDFSALDEIVNNLSSANIKILLTITAAPTWARTFILENGPPDNVSDFAPFVSALVGRYAGRVQAYEIWSEPNRRSEWSCTEQPEQPRFCSTRYIDLLQVAYSAVKSADPSAIVISAGLAPTGYNDGINAIDDRLFLSNLYAEGLQNVSDAIGAHPLGWANPPDAACCSEPDGVPTHYENPSFYFRNTLDDYRLIMVDSGDASTPIWVTKFGWGTSEDTSAPAENNIFVSYTSLEEQAVYVTRAFQLGTELGFIGPMFLDNLNGCVASRAETCYYSLIGSNGLPRPVYYTVAALITGVMPPIIETSEVPTELAPTEESLDNVAKSTPEPTVDGSTLPESPTFEPLPMEDITPVATPAG